MINDGTAVCFTATCTGCGIRFGTSEIAEKWWLCYGCYITTSDAEYAS